MAKHTVHPAPKSEEHKGLAEKPGPTEFTMREVKPSTGRKRGERDTPARTYNIVVATPKKGY